MQVVDLNYCYYSDLPSPMAYMQEDVSETLKEFLIYDVDRIIEMAWQDRIPFEAIKQQFRLNESDVKSFMKKTLKFSSYKRWREKVENCKTKHFNRRVLLSNRFKYNLQRTITHNKISKRRTK